MVALPTSGSVVAGKYRVEALLGEGGMGAVFRAHHMLMDKPVALKWLRPELSARSDARDRFIREAQAAARIEHPNVVDVFDVGMHGSSLFMVMELLEGRSLADLLRQHDIPVWRMVRWLMGAMEGVAAAHERGIIHRDIKPDNIFLVYGPKHPQGVAKILDFGISKLTGGDRNRRSLTQSGYTIGTPEYMSMEQMSAAQDVDVRTDVYSFGVLLYRALTGHAPFKAETFAAVAVKVATHRPPPPRTLRPDLPPALDGIVMKAMAFRREQRYPSMSALIAALEASGVAEPSGDSQPVGLAGRSLPAAGARQLPTRTFPPGADGSLAQRDALGHASTEPSPSTPNLAVRSGGRAARVLTFSLLLGGAGLAIWALPSQRWLPLPSLRAADPPPNAMPTAAAAGDMPHPAPVSVTVSAPVVEAPLSATPTGSLRADGSESDAGTPDSELEALTSGAVAEGLPVEAPRAPSPSHRVQAVSVRSARFSRQRARRDGRRASTAVTASAATLSPAKVSQAAPASTPSPSAAPQSGDEDDRRSGNLRRFDF